MAKGKGKKKKRPEARPAAAPAPAPAPAPARAPARAPAPALAQGRRGSAPAAPQPRADARSRGRVSYLQTHDDPRVERRYEPRTSVGAVLTVLGMSLGALSVGAGVYGQWLRPLIQKVPPLPFSFWLLGLGAAIFGALAAVGAKQPLPVRVGDAGVGIEKDNGDVDRMGWCDVLSVHLGPEGATLESPATAFTILASHHPEALRDLVKEAGRRVEPKVEGELGPLGSGPAPEALELDPPQVTGQRCRASDRLISVEEDARLCGRCGELYHARGVPPRCMTCEAPLA